MSTHESLCEINSVTDESLNEAKQKCDKKSFRKSVPNLSLLTETLNTHKTVKITEID